MTLRLGITDGGAEEIVAEVVVDQYPGVLFVTTVYPRNASDNEAMTDARRREWVDSGQSSDSQTGEHRGIFGDKRGQLRMRGFELLNGLF